MKNKKFIFLIYLVLALFCVSTLSACDALSAILGGGEAEPTEETASEEAGQDAASDGGDDEALDETSSDYEEEPVEEESKDIINVGTVVTSGPWYATVDLVEIEDTLSVGIAPSFSQGGGNSSTESTNETPEDATGTPDGSGTAGDASSGSSAPVAQEPTGDDSQPTETPAEPQNQSTPPADSDGSQTQTPSNGAQDELAAWTWPFSFRNLFRQVDTNDELATDDSGLTSDQNAQSGQSEADRLGSSSINSAGEPQSNSTDDSYSYGTEDSALADEDTFDGSDTALEETPDGDIVDETLDEGLVDDSAADGESGTDSSAASGVVPFGIMSYDGHGVDISEFDDVYKISCSLEIIGIVDTEAQGTFSVSYGGEAPTSYVVNLVLSDDMQTMTMTCDSNADLNSILWIEDDTKAKLTVSSKFLFSGLNVNDSITLPEEEYLDLTLADSTVGADNSALVVDILTGNLDFVLADETLEKAAVSGVTNTAAIDGYALVYDDDQEKWFWMAEDQIKELQNEESEGN